MRVLGESHKTVKTVAGRPEVAHVRRVIELHSEHENWSEAEKALTELRANTGADRAVDDADLRSLELRLKLGAADSDE